jgi:hypothetical protein
MSRLISAIVQDKQVLQTALGTRVHLNFRTVDGHNVTIRAPIEDCYLSSAGMSSSAAPIFWNNAEIYF